MIKKTILFVVLALAIIGIFVFLRFTPSPSNNNPEFVPASYSDNNVKVAAIFDITNDMVTFSHPAVGTTTLPLAMSASGARYANEDESIVFWEHQDELTIIKDEIIVFKGKKDNQVKLLSGSFGQEQLEKGIINYLLTQQQFSWTTTEGSHRFCSVDNLDSENKLFPFYVWAYCGEYIIDNGELKNLSGSSGPVKINYPNELSFYRSDDFSHEAPRDGSYYDDDVREIFPENLHSKIFDFNREEIINRVERFALSNILTWESIKDAIQHCEVDGVFQAHDRTVLAKVKGGEIITSVEPNIDDIINLATQSEPDCGKIVIATE